MTSQTSSDETDRPVQRVRSSIAQASLQGWSAWLAIPLSAGLAIAAFTGAETSLEARAEGTFLALVATLAFIGSLRAGRRDGLGLLLCGPLLATMAVVLVPAGPTRGLAFSLALVATVVLSLRKCLPIRTNATTTLSAALALQIVLRQSELLGSSWLDLVLLFVVLPSLSAWAATRLAQGSLRPVYLLALVALARGEIDITSTVTLLAFAWMPEVESLRGRSRTSQLWLVATIALVVGFTALDAPSGLLIAAALGTRIFPRGWLAIAFVLAGLLMLFREPLGWRLALAGLPILGLLAPLGIVMPVFRDDRGWQSPVRVAVLALLALHWLPPPSVLPALALLLESQRQSHEPSRPLRGFATTWFLMLLAGALWLATYPWLQTSDASQLLTSVGLESGWARGLLLVVILALLSASPQLVLWAQARSWQWAIAGGVLAIATALSADRQVLLGWPPQVLDSDRPLWHSPEIDDGRCSLTLDASLSNAVALPAGSTVLRAHLAPAHAAGASFELRSAEHLDDWMANPRGPRVGFHWVASDGKAFGKSYRVRIDSPSCSEGERWSLERPTELPEEVTVTLRHAAATRP